MATLVIAASASEHGDHGAWRPEASDGTQCLGSAGSYGKSATCLPSWKPTWDMKRSTVLYTCNNSGMHAVSHAVEYGTVVYDWSNAKKIWANAHPMSSEELITEQAEMVLAVDPGVEGYNPRVWAYRNSIKALNWYSSVREKLDDPKYSSWFAKFRGFDDKTYPGGTQKDSMGKDTNGTFHVPTCDWYGTAAKPAKCSGFYHDQEQTPEKAKPGGGSYPAYKVDGECIEQCDCGATNPCAEYIFDNRGGMVEGRNFTQWFLDEYMITNETLLHKNPTTGKPQVIGLGWLDDSMTPHGPTEEDRNYMADTGADDADMQTQVAAYKTSMTALVKKVLPMGGYWWQLMDGSGIKLAAPPRRGKPATPAQCKSTLAGLCTEKPAFWNRMAMYNIGGGGKGLNETDLKQYTAEFMLTRGPYAMLGYSWYGCTGSAAAGGGASPDPPRATEWDVDFGEPSAPCKETAAGSGIFSRDWGKATVSWDCSTGLGDIKMKAGFEHELTNPPLKGKSAWTAEVVSK
jgi:hypothetical protein